MSTYTDVFGGDAIWPTRVSYSALAITADTALAWGAEGSSNAVSDIMDISSDAARTITMPDARKASPGHAVIFNNTGSYTIAINSNSGSLIISVEAGDSYTLYLKTNATAAGTWGAIQSGAVTAAAQASGLVGYGLVALSGVLNTKIDVQAFSATYTTGLSDRAKVLQWTGGSGTLNLPDPSTMTDSWYVSVKNDGSGTLTVTPAAGTIDGASSLSLATQESCFIVTDGAEYLTIGRGRSATTTIEYISINVAGTGNYTLSAGQQNKAIYNFTGLLTGNRNIIVPASVSQYTIVNATTGSYTLTVKTAAGTGQEVTQGGQSILFCDGTNVEAATSSFPSPLPVADGGTGANNASSARINLGASSIGATIFTAANEAAVRTALSLTVGTNVQAYSAQLASLAALASNGIIARSASNTIINRTITGTANELTVTNGDGVSGNPTLSIPSAVTLTGKTMTGGTFSAPVFSGSITGTYTLAGTPTLTSPTINNATMTAPALGTPASGVLTNATGLPLTTGVTGTLPVANGGTGATTLTANNVILGNGTSAVQVVAPGTSGNVLTSNGTTWASTTPPGMTLIGTLTMSGTTQTQAISTAYKMILCVLVGVSHDAGAGRQIRVAISHDGSTFGASDQASPSVLASAAISGEIAIYRADETLTSRPMRVTVSDGLDIEIAGTSVTSSGAFLHRFALAATSSGAVAGIRFSLSSTGSFDAGTIHIYGIK